MVSQTLAISKNTIMGDHLYIEIGCYNIVTIESLWNAFG